MIERGVIVNHSLNAHTVIRLTPPAVLTAADADLVLTAVAGAAGALRDSHPHTTTLERSA